MFGHIHYESAIDIALHTHGDYPVRCTVHDMAMWRLSDCGTGEARRGRYKPLSQRAHDSTAEGSSFSPDIFIRIFFVAQRASASSSSLQYSAPCMRGLHF